MDVLEAKFNKIIYQTSDLGVSIGLYKASDKCYVVTGSMLPTGKKLKYIFKGSWVKHAKYGLQFNASEGYEVQKPNDKEGVIEFLSSGAIKGIGKLTAKKIVDYFGEKAIDILDEDFTRLREIKGITEKRYKKIKESWDGNFEGREAILELTKNGISPKLASKAYQEFKKKTLTYLKEKPYMLCIVPGISFPQADSLGPSTEVYEKSIERFSICANFVLQENENNGLRAIIGNRTSGSLCMEANDFGNCMLSLLNKGTYTKEEILANTIKLIKEEKLFFIRKNGKQYVYKSGIYRIEKQLAEDMASFIEEENCDFNIDGDITEYEKENRLILGAEQKEAIKNAFKNKLSLIIGPPGTGKTTILKAIAYIYKKRIGEELCFLAPTGKAAYRIKESTGLPAYTIHSRISIGTEIISDLIEIEEEKISGGLVVIDELSMIDIRTAYQLFANINPSCKIVLCGDDAQLQSVGAGAFLSDIISSKVVPTTVLKTIFRQAEESSIKVNSLKIRNNEIDLILSNDFYVLEESDILVAEDIIIDRYLKKIEEYGINEVMLLTPFKEHECGVVSLNKKIQEKLHPEALQTKEFKYGTKVFRIGDQVMQLKNSEEQVNGEIGTVIDIAKIDGEQQLTVSFTDSERTYIDDESDELTLAYAYTIHKSQGSEAKCAIIFLNSQLHKNFLKRNTVCTAVSRSEEECIIVGNMSALIRAIQTSDTSENSMRNTGLKEFLQDEKCWRLA